MKRKILQINTVINSGSTGRITEEIGQIAMASHWESYIAYGREENRPSKSHKIRIGNDYDMYLHGIQTRILDNHSLGLSSRSATKKLVKKIKEIKPDIIHLQNLHGYYINVDVLFNFLKTANIPVVWTLHDCWGFTGHCSFFELIGCEKWKIQCHECPQTRKYPASFVFDRSKENYIQKKELFNYPANLTLVPVSNWLAKLLRESFLKTYPIQVIHNGIDTAAFKPCAEEDMRIKLKLENKFVLLGVASEWSARKGLKDFIKLSGILGDEYHIILVGLGKDQIASLPQNVIGIERTESIEELAALYGMSDIFLNPTYSDNFPTTNLEALACGTPVITYNTGGSPEAIDAETGIVVPQGDFESLVSAINTIRLKGKDHYRSACVDRARNFYRKEDRFKEYINLYDRILET